MLCIWFHDKQSLFRSVNPQIAKSNWQCSLALAKEVPISFCFLETFKFTAACQKSFPSMALWLALRWDTSSLCILLPCNSQKMSLLLSFFLLFCLFFTFFLNWQGGSVVLCALRPGVTTPLCGSHLTLLLSLFFFTFSSSLSFYSGTIRTAQE